MGELVDTRFRIFDCPICISEERAAYNRIRLDFIKLANEAAEQYETLYKQDGSIQKVVEKLGEQTHNCLVPALDYCIDTLVRYNVIDIDIQAYDPANEIYWHASPYSNSVEIVNAYCTEGHQYYDRYVYYSYADVNYKEIIKYGFQTVEKNVLADDAYMGCDGAGLLGESTGPISEQDVYAYLATIKSSNPDILIITDAKQYLAQVLSQPDYMRVVNEYTDEDGLHVAELATKGTDKYYKNS